MNFKNRRSIRLRDYDYAQVGAYFVTICTQYRQRLFGDVLDGVMVLNDAGIMIQRIWDEIPIYYHGVAIDEFVIMPDHIHGIVVISPSDPHVGAIPPWLPGFKKTCLSPVRNNGCIPVRNNVYVPVRKPHIHPPYLGRKSRDKNEHEQFVGSCDETGGNHRGIAPTGVSSLPDIVRCFKTLTTKRYIDGVHTHNWPPFPEKLWQRNYYEHIIRNDISLTRIRQYIANNPKKWHPPPWPSVFSKSYLPTVRK